VAAFAAGEDGIIGAGIATQGQERPADDVRQEHLLAIYAGSYAAFRQTHQEVWQKDKQTYVIFPSGAIGQARYYVWRPLAYADSSLTGIRFHVRPQRSDA
jgi:hypothetical protein